MAAGALEGCKAVFKQVQARYAQCDILVNSAGATQADVFLDLAEESWQDGLRSSFLVSCGCAACSGPC